MGSLPPTPALQQHATLPFTISTTTSIISAGSQEGGGEEFISSCEQQPVLSRRPTELHSSGSRA